MFHLPHIPPEQLGTLAEWAAALAAVVTALILIYQIQDLRKTVQNQTYQAVYSEMLKLDRFFFDNWELREHFYEGKPLPQGEKMQAQAKIVAELICDLFDDVYHQRSTMPPRTFEEWRTYMRKLFKECEVLRTAMESRTDWYPKDYRDDVLYGIVRPKSRWSRFR